MDHASEVEENFHLARKVGSLFIGNIIAAILYGVTCAQVLKYLKRSSNNHRPMCAVIIFLWLLDTVPIVLITHALYYYLITEYGHPDAIEYATWSFLTQIIITCVDELIIRSYFVWRLWYSAPNRHLLAAVVFSILLASSTGFAAAGTGLKVTEFERLFRLAYLLYIHVAASAVTEIIITGQLIVNLWRSRRSIKRTESILTVLSLYTINTAFLTTLCSIAVLVTFILWPHKPLYIAIYASKSKLFLHSLLAALQTKTHHSAEIESNHNATASPEEPILGENCEAYDRSETQSPMTPATLCGTDDGTATLNESIDDKGFQKWNGSKFHENFDTDHEDEKKGKGKEIYGKEINTTSRVQLSSLELV